MRTAPEMIERTPILDFICHAILIAGAALICLPIYFAFVASTLTISEVQQVPLPWLPGSHLFDNAAMAWQKARSRSQ